MLRITRCMRLVCGASRFCCGIDCRASCQGPLSGLAEAAKASFQDKRALLASQRAHSERIRAKKKKKKKKTKKGVFGLWIWSRAGRRASEQRSNVAAEQLN